jgi:hypothetical protein
MKFECRISAGEDGLPADLLSTRCILPTSTLLKNSECRLLKRPQKQGARSSMS